MRRLTLVAYATPLLAVGLIALTGQPRAGGGRGPAPPRFDTDRALAHLRVMSDLTERGGGRAVGAEGHREVVSYIARHFEEAGLTTRLAPFEDRIGGGMVNVLGELPGQEREIVVLGAHHDANGGPAAVEGLGGLAVLLESARALSEARRTAAAPGATGAGRSVLFASWDGEAFGCAGSTEFVRRLADGDGRSIRAKISLDSLGWKGGTPVVHVPRYFDRFGREHAAPDWLVGRVVGSAREAGVSAAVGDRWLSVPYQAALRLVDLGYYSDDRSFLLAGIPSLFISDFSLTRFYPFYGSAQDTFEQIGREPLQAAGRLVTAAISDLAGAESLPAGESGYLMLPFPAGTFRLTADHLKLLAALLLLPGLVVLGRAACAPSGRPLLALYAAMAAVFLYGALTVDPILYTLVAGPALLSAPLLAVAGRRGLYGFLASLLPVIGCALVIAQLLREGYERQLLLGGAGIASLLLFAGLGLAAALTKGVAGGTRPGAPASVHPL